MGDGKLAVAYLRVSTEEQRLGPEAQRNAIEVWAKHAGVNVIAWHADAGVSGGAELEDRPGLLSVLEDVRTHRAGLLVVAKRDRLARDVYVAATIERAARAAGASVVTADGAGAGDDPSAAFMRTMLDGAAAYERGLIRARTKAALQAKKAKGERAGTLPYGYTVASDGSKLEKNPQEQAIISRVRELRSGGASFRDIVDALSLAGVTSRNGGALGLSQVHSMAKSS